MFSSFRIMKSKYDSGVKKPNKKKKREEELIKSQSGAMLRYLKTQNLLVLIRIVELIKLLEGFSFIFRIGP